MNLILITIILLPVIGIAIGIVVGFVLFRRDDVKDSHPQDKDFWFEYHNWPTEEEEE